MSIDCTNCLIIKEQLVLRRVTLTRQNAKNNCRLGRAARFTGSDPNAVADAPHCSYDIDGRRQVGATS
jgi:hypothetical protein